MNLRTLDLNLLPVFEAIYVERSLTRAAETLHLTQPAVSNALARLRHALDDPLFVRQARHIRPTPVADALIGPVREALARLSSGLDARKRFDPATSERVFTIAMGDAAAARFVPALACRVAEAPNIRFDVCQVERDKVARELAAGGLDLAVDIASVARADLDSVALADKDEYACILRRGHPASHGRLTLAKFLALHHVVVSSRRRGRTRLESALRDIGERIRPAFRLHDHHTAFEVVMATDLALVARLSLARRFDVVVRPLPFAMSHSELRLYWRPEMRHDPAHAWARAVLLNAAGAAGFR